MPPLKPSAVSPESVYGSFSMCVASGPYTPDADLKYKPWHTFVQNLKSVQPAVVLLVRASSCPCMNSYVAYIISDWPIR